MLEKMQSDQINELATALSKVQGELTPAIKDSKNPFFKSSYADLSSVWNCCKDALSKYGLAIIQTMDAKDGQNVLITTLAHASGQWMRSCLPILNEKNNAQGLGSAITYMRRYALSAIVGITCDDDDDGNEACSQKNIKKTEGESDLVTPEQARTIASMLAECDDVFANNVENYYQKKFGVSSWSVLPRGEYEKLYSNISNKLNGKAI
jgi:ERF superfamily